MIKMDILTTLVMLTQTAALVVITLALIFFAILYIFRKKIGGLIIFLLGALAVIGGALMIIPGVTAIPGIIIILGGISLIGWAMKFDIIEKIAKVMIKTR